MRKALELIGAPVTDAATGLFVYGEQRLSRVGELVGLFGRICARIPLFARNPALTFHQMILIGISSLPLVMVTSFFVGAVSAVSAAYQFRGFIPLDYLGTAVCKSVLLETGPVMTALVLAGRVSSAIAAELGTMKEKEELDAMAVLDLDHLRYLAVPRFLAGVLMFPVLTIIANCLALVGGWMISVATLKLTSATYVFGLRFLFDPFDLYIGLFKAMVFGGVVVLMGYHNGLGAGAGARGVGQASMKAVVSSCVLILFFDFLIVYLAF